jgi:lipopolysaccharide/colanic/teichoic acid biosynthesis glycosyltransferase
MRDISLALLLLCAGAWILLLLIPLLALTQERIFFRQQRTGYKGKPFLLVKFSTMRDVLPGEKEEDAQLKRLTPIGRVLRRFSLDEWPQMWNVLKGDMSLVGPRPLIHDYWPLYSEEQKKRFEVLPGITGWAQVNGRNAISFTERFRLDVWYVEHQSFGLDLRILFLTLKNALSGKGIYADRETTMAKFDGTN